MPRPADPSAASSTHELATALLRASQVADATALGTELPIPLQWPHGPRTPLPRPEPHDLRPWSEVLAARTSLRYFAQRAITAADVAAVLHAAVCSDTQAYPSEVRAGLGLQLLVATRAVDGITPALHVLVEDGWALQRIAELPRGEAAADLVLQREFADAALTVLVIGDLEAACARHGDHGHRSLLIRAGAAAHAVWLTAIARGLGGSVFAGALPGALRELAGVEGARRLQLFACAVGHPRRMGAD